MQKKFRRRAASWTYFVATFIDWRRRLLSAVLSNLCFPQQEQRGKGCNFLQFDPVMGQKNRGSKVAKDTGFGQIGHIFARTWGQRSRVDPRTSSARVRASWLWQENAEKHEPRLDKQKWCIKKRIKKNQVANFHHLWAATSCRDFLYVCWRSV